MKQRTLGIRKETKSPFERRVPLTPDVVRDLVSQHGLRVQVESSGRRVFPDAAWSAAGAEIVDDCFDADVVIAVKEIPTKLLRESGTYLYFSHTIKGQPYNMDMLRRLVELRCSLMDYERVTDEQGRRLIFFSWYAGAAGAVNTLWTWSQRMAARGLTGPLAQLQRTWEYGGLAQAKGALAQLGAHIAQHGVPAPFGPLVIGITGYGNVSKGAQHMLEQLPIERVSPEDLPTLRARARHDRVYLVVFREEHMFAPREAGAPFDLQEYFSHPERYRSIFEPQARHLDLLIHGIYWTEDCPRLLTNAQLAEWADAWPRLEVVGDISCDVEGSIECLVKTTVPDNPCFVYDPRTQTATDGVNGTGLAMMAVDFLPAECPAESSQAFSDALAPYMPGLLAADFSGPLDQLELPAPLRRALILHRGEFTPEYAYMADFLEN